MAKTIKTQCSACSGTGLYEGFAERKGEPVICLVCRGTGCETLTYEPYSGRKEKRGVKVVRVSRGTFIATGVGGIGSGMTYEQFKESVREESF